jgi:hypothetical protein
LTAVALALWVGSGLALDAVAIIHNVGAEGGRPSVGFKPLTEL